MKKQLLQTLCVFTGAFALSASYATAAEKDLVDTALASGDFHILTKALEVTGLDKELKGKGPYTVFAPSDKAFMKLPKDSLHTLLLPENKDQLAQVLKYHVLAGKSDGAKVVTLKQAKTLNGQPIKVQFKNAALYINKSRIVATDVTASNGVIHVVDSVLMPKIITPKKEAKATPPKSAVTGKSAVSNKILNDALKLGTELFNSGSEKACESVYKIAVTAVLEIKPKQIPHKDYLKVRNTLEAIQDSKDTRANAWSLRRAMEAMIEHLAK